MLILFAITPTHFVCAEDKVSEKLSDTIKQIEAEEPAFGHELRRLASESPGVREALQARVVSGASAERLADLWKWDYILPLAFASAGYDFTVFKQRWPLIVSRSNILCVVADESGVKHLIVCPMGVPNGLKRPIELIWTYNLSGEIGDEFETHSEADQWFVQTEGGREILSLVKWYRPSNDEGTQSVRTQRLRINKAAQFELLDDKTETFRWTPELESKAFSFKYPEPYDPKAPAPITSSQRASNASAFQGQRDHAANLRKLCGSQSGKHCNNYNASSEIPHSSADRHARRST